MGASGPGAPESDDPELEEPSKDIARASGLVPVGTDDDVANGELIDGEKREALHLKLTKREEWLIREAHRGPLPRPQDLAKYNEVYDGLAREIVQMAKAEQAHRHEIERLEVQQPFRLASRGQQYGLAALIVLAMLAGFMVYKGSPEWAAGIAGLELTAVVSIFVTGQRRGRSDDSGDTEEDVDDAFDDDSLPTPPRDGDPPAISPAKGKP